MKLALRLFGFNSTDLKLKIEAHLLSQFPCRWNDNCTNTFSFRDLGEHNNNKILHHSFYTKSADWIWLGILLTILRKFWNAQGFSKLFPGAINALNETFNVYFKRFCKNWYLNSTLSLQRPLELFWGKWQSISGPQFVETILLTDTLFDVYPRVCDIPTAWKSIAVQRCLQGKKFLQEWLVKSLYESFNELIFVKLKQNYFL